MTFATAAGGRRAGEPIALASDGDAATRSDWEQAAAAVLRRSGQLSAVDPDDGVWSALATTTLDGIDVPPLGTLDDEVAPEQSRAPGLFPFTRGRLASRPEHGWDLRCQLSGLPPVATNEAALVDLEGGATSVWLTVGGPLAPADLPRALAGVQLDLAPVVLDSPTDPVGAAAALTELFTASGVTPAPGTNLGVDPVGAGLRALEAGSGTTVGPAEMVGQLAAVVDLAREYGTLAVVVDAGAVHDRGASDAQELGYSLAVGAAYLRALTASGMSVETALALMEFRYCATDEQLVTIAKLRAARRVWARVAQLSQAPPIASAQRQHAVTSRPMMSTRDPYVNVLRTTVAAFAAGVGGADAVTVLPFDAPSGQPSSLGRRVARNTSSLLVWESRVATVSDPAGGAYAIERLTDELARAAWAEFGRVETSGGVQHAIADGSLLERVEQVALRRDADVAHRRRPMTGLTEFPNPDQPSLDRAADPCVPPVRRYGAAFEALQNDPAPLPVFLATLGPVAAHTTRATFATNLFAAGGVRVVSAGATDDTPALLVAYDGEAVVCLCGTDAAYSDRGADTVAALRHAGARWVVLAGRPGAATVPEALIDDVAAVGVDALALLRRTRVRLA